ncbi:MAG: hypothetical protein U1F43_08910 [Myxococcota bacterium]
MLVTHPPAHAGVAAFTVGRRPSAAPDLGDEGFDAEVAVTDPSFGGVSRIVGWLDVPTRAAVAELVASGWVSGARGWRRRFEDARVAPAEVSAAVDHAAALVRRLSLPPGAPHAAPIAARALGDPHAAVRVTALEVLADRWRDDPATAAAVRDLVARPPTLAAERRAVVALLAHRPVPGGEAVLLQWLESDDPGVAAAAGDALALVGSALAIPALRRKGLRSAIEAIQRRIGSGPAGGLSLSDPNAAGALALAEAAKEGQDA